MEIGDALVKRLGGMLKTKGGPDGANSSWCFEKVEGSGGGNDVDISSNSGFGPATDSATMAERNRLAIASTHMRRIRVDVL